MIPTLEEAIKVLQKHLREDKSEGSYYGSWKDNIAMAFYDQVNSLYTDEENSVLFSKKQILNNANLAAKNFLDSLIKE